MSDPATVWGKVLQAVELEMTRATFDAWLRDTCPEDSSNGTLVIGARNPQAVAWLNGRLRPVIERAVMTVAGEALPVQFVVHGSPVTPAAEDEVDDAAQRAQIHALLEVLGRVEDHQARAVIAGQIRALGGVPGDREDEEVWIPPEVDTSGRWFPVPEYATRFWAPLLGRIAFRVWEIVRQLDTRPARVKRDEVWTPPRRFTAPELARQVPCGRLSISGVWRRCEAEHPDAVLRTPKRLSGDMEEGDLLPYRRQKGALTVLQEHGVARIVACGAGRRKAYQIEVRITPPLLSPLQWNSLHEELRVEHDNWLRESSDFDPHKLYH